MSMLQAKAHRCRASTSKCRSCTRSIQAAAAHAADGLRRRGLAQGLAGAHLVHTSGSWRTRHSWGARQIPTGITRAAHRVLK